MAIKCMWSLKSIIYHTNLGLYMHQMSKGTNLTSQKKIFLVWDLVGIYFVHALGWLQVCTIGSYYMAEVYVSGLCLYLTVAEMNTTVNHCGSVTENRDMLSLSSLMAPEVVVMTTSGAINDDKVGITRGFQWCSTNCNSLYKGVCIKPTFQWNGRHNKCIISCRLSYFQILFFDGCVISRDRDHISIFKWPIIRFRMKEQINLKE